MCLTHKRNYPGLCFSFKNSDATINLFSWHFFPLMSLILLNWIKICSLPYTHINITDSIPLAYSSEFLNFHQLFYSFPCLLSSFKPLFSSIYFEVMQVGCLSAPALSEVHRLHHIYWEFHQLLQQIPMKVSHSQVHFGCLWLPHTQPRSLCQQGDPQTAVGLNLDRGMNQQPVALAV